MVELFPVKIIEVRHVFQLAELFHLPVPFIFGQQLLDQYSATCVFVVIRKLQLSCLDLFKDLVWILCIFAEG